MVYEVQFTETAFGDLEEYAEYISRDSPSRAVKWIASAKAQCFALTEMPKKFPVLEAATDPAVRSFNHYSHRVIYRIDDNMLLVTVLRVLPAAMELKSADLVTD